MREMHFSNCDKRELVKGFGSSDLQIAHYHCAQPLLHSSHARGAALKPPEVYSQAPITSEFGHRRHECSAISREVSPYK